jgi:putative flippase GtrA
MGQISRSSFLRFLLVGGSATLLHYSIMAGLIGTAHIAAGAASAAGFSASTFYNYWASSQFTFGGAHRHGRSLPRFLATSLTGLAINQIILMAGIYLSLPVIIAQLAATTVVLFWNYFINATWTFATKDL